MRRRVRVLLIDNYDSYTYNLADLLVASASTEVELSVLCNDDPALGTLSPADLDAVVMSPGPGSPSVGADVGASALLLADLAHLPVLGVCLGHQLLAQLCGGVVRRDRPRHGHISTVRHDGSALFDQIPREFSATRYHSLSVRSTPQSVYDETAWAEDGTLMALEVRDRPWFGVQFHPESIETGVGTTLIDNFLRIVCAHAGVSPGRSAVAPAPGRAVRVAGAAAAEHVVETRLASTTIDAAGVFAACFGSDPTAFWLDHNDPVTPGRSILGSASGRHGEVLTYHVGAGTTATSAGASTHSAATIWEVLEQRLAAGAATTWGPLPGGYVGFFGYGCKTDVPGGSSHAVAGTQPDAVWIRAERVVELDHRSGEVVIRCLTSDDGADQHEAREWVDSTAALLGRPDPPPPAAARHTSASPREPLWVRDDEQYLDDIARCQAHLAAGESYEICLANQLTLRPAVDPYVLYLTMRELSPTSRSAYLRLDDITIASTSPETFLSIDQHRVVTARPIKGTVRRGDDAAEDEALRDSLSTSAKTRAENLMIVDLLRNDLNRICRPATVTVPRYLEVETYSTLHQLVSTVTGVLADDVPVVQAVRSCFPPGSMTGAPKVRTMQIIDRLEPVPRGAYSGAFGYFGADQTVQLGVTIRTAVAFAGAMTVGAGGAITIDSDPADELAEVRLKAGALVRSHDLALRGLDVTDDELVP